MTRGHAPQRRAGRGFPRASSHEPEVPEQPAKQSETRSPRETPDLSAPRGTATPTRTRRARSEPWERRPPAAARA
jgi:hypothetical protein